MEFTFDCQTLFQNLDSNNVVILDSFKDKPMGRISSKTLQLFQLIDNMGAASALAQKLPQVITTGQKFYTFDDNKLYLMVQGKKCLGLLKTGKKNLFIRTADSSLKEIKPLCVLDFYVHESCQRNGIGKILFEKMLQHEKIQPHKIAYDRPSEKLLGFLRKHYNLSRFTPQSNNFVVFSSYFDVSAQPLTQTNFNVRKSQELPQRQSYYEQFKKQQNKIDYEEKKIGYQSQTQKQQSRESTCSSSDDEFKNQNQKRQQQNKSSERASIYSMNQTQVRYSNQKNASSGVSGIFGFTQYSGIESLGQQSVSPEQILIKRGGLLKKTSTQQIQLNQVKDQSNVQMAVQEEMMKPTKVLTQNLKNLNSHLSVERLATIKNQNVEKQQFQIDQESTSSSCDTTADTPPLQIAPSHQKQENNLKISYEQQQKNKKKQYKELLERQAKEVRKIRRGLNTSPFKSFDEQKKCLGNTENQRHKHYKEHKKQRKTFQDKFKLIMPIGDTDFSQVWLCLNKQTDKLYAVKIINKDFTDSRHLKYSQMLEKKILLHNNHPNLLKLKFAYQTNKEVFLVSDYQQGGDLNIFTNRILRNKTFQEKDAKFYVACVILAISYLHKHGIVYRDIKMENTLIDKDGYAVLGDFGVCKELKYRPSSCCGTKDFLPPEVMVRNKQTNAVDWWTLGCLIYQLLVGKVPFTHEIHETEDNKPKIQAQFDQPYFPIDLSYEAKNIIMKLLIQDPKKRLGSGKDGALEIMQHPWFNEINFCEIYSRQYKAPFQLADLSSCSQEYQKLFINQEFTQNDIKDLFKQNTTQLDQSYKIIKQFCLNPHPDAKPHAKIIWQIFNGYYEYIKNGKFRNLDFQKHQEDKMEKVQKQMKNDATFNMVKRIRQLLGPDQDDEFNNWSDLSFDEEDDDIQIQNSQSREGLHSEKQNSKKEERKTPEKLEPSRTRVPKTGGILKKDSFDIILKKVNVNLNKCPSRKVNLVTSANYLNKIINEKVDNSDEEENQGPIQEGRKSTNQLEKIPVQNFQIKNNKKIKIETNSVDMNEKRHSVKQEGKRVVINKQIKANEFCEHQRLVLQCFICLMTKNRLQLK